MSSANIKEHQSENSHVLMMRQMDPREVNSLVEAEPKFHVHYFPTVLCCLWWVNNPG